jgi:hypothetical protein
MKAAYQIKIFGREKRGTSKRGRAMGGLMSVSTFTLTAGLCLAPACKKQTLKTVYILCGWTPASGPSKPYLLPGGTVATSHLILPQLLYPSWLALV